MSGPSDFRPQPGDWDIPTEFKEALGPVSYAVLSESELDGVPVGVGFQVSEDYGAIFELLETEPDPGPIMARIAEARAPWEARYPGAIMFDRIHSDIATRLAERGHVDEAFGLLSTVISPYEVIKSIGDMSKLGISENFDLNSMVSRILDQYQGERSSGLVRALRDYLIDNALSPDTVEILDTRLVEDGTETDPISGWIESRKLGDPRTDWSVMEAMTQEDLWPADMPSYWKRYTLLSLKDGLRQINNGEIESDIEGAVGIFDDFENHFGKAKIWDQLRAGLAARAFHKREMVSANRFAATITDPEAATVLAVMVSQFDKASAIEIAANNPDPKQVVELLASIDEGDEDVGITKLSELVQDDETLPKERRLAIMEAVRDRFSAMNAFDLAVQWQDRIDDLRKDT